MSATALACLLLLQFPVSTPTGIGDRSQGLFLRPGAMVSSSGIGGLVPIRVLPGDPAICFDVAVGPLTLTPGDPTPSPADVGIAIYAMDVSQGGDRGPRSTNDWAPFVPLSSRTRGLRVRWVDDDDENRFVQDVEVYAVQGTTWALARACLESEPSFNGDYWLAASAPAAAMRGMASGAEPGPSPEGGLALKSAAFRVRFGPAKDPGTDRDEVMALRDRARRLGLLAEEADLFGRLAVIDLDDRWRGSQADLLFELGRVDEAYALWAKAAEACGEMGEGESGRCEQWKLRLAAQSGQGLTAPPEHP